MPAFLCSPTEPPELKDSLDAIVSLICEERGADILAFLKNTDGQTITAGWQRKHAPGDYTQSIKDGRLAREVQLMQQLTHPILIIEGEMRYSEDGCLYASNGKRTKYTKQQIRNLERTARYIWGIHVEHTKDITDTATAIREMIIWLRKNKHDSLRRRAPLQSDWGVPSQTEQQLYFMQGIPKVGSQLAENIVEHFGGIPMRWRCTEQDLREVNKIGKKKAHEIFNFLPKLYKKGGEIVGNERNR